MARSQQEPWQANFRAWFIGETAASVGSGMSAFAFPLIALAVTGSPKMAGLIGLIQGIGALVGLLPGGVVADRYDRKRIRIAGGCLGFTLQLTLVCMLVANLATGPALATIAFIDSFRSGICAPSSEALLKQLVPRTLLPEKFATNSGRDAAVDIGVAPLSGASMAMHAAFPVAASAIGNFFLVCTSLLIRTPDVPRVTRSGVRVREALNELSEALRWIAGQRIRLHVIAVATFLNFASSGALVTLTLQFGSEGLPYVQIGLVTTGLSASVLVGAVVAPYLTRRLKGSTIAAWTLVVLSIALSVIAFWPSFWVALVCLAGVGLGIAPLIASTTGYLAQVTPEGMLGRVDAISTLGSSALLPLAPAIAGFGIEQWGPGVTVGVFAVASFVCLASVFVVRGGIRDVPIISAR